jgi:hypothetical protein
VMQTTGGESEICINNKKRGLRTKKAEATEGHACATRPRRRRSGLLRTAPYTNFYQIAATDVCHMGLCTCASLSLNKRKAPPGVWLRLI